MKQNFRTITSVVAISAMIVFATSCAKDELSKEAQQRIPGVERTISATAALPQDADKAHIDGSRKVIWDMGDELNINGTNVAIKSIVSGGTGAKFDVTTVHANTVSGTDHYWAVYPTILAGAYSGGLPTEFTSTSALTVHFPDTQIVDITLADTLNGLTYMASHVAVADGAEKVHFQMRNLGAVLELNLQSFCANSSRVDSIVFTSSDASLAGTFSVSADATNPTITPTAGSNKLVVKFQDNGNKYIDITDAKKVRVILPPLAGKNLNMKIYCRANYMEKNAATITLARTKYYSSAISYNPSLEGFSVAANKRVYISPGNLQWSASNGGTTYTSHATADGVGAEGTWRFALNQWDYVGDATYGNVYGVGGDMSVKCNNNQISSTYQGWIDLFAFGNSGYHDPTDPYNTNYYPYSYAEPSVNATYNSCGYGPSTNMTDPDLVGTSAYYDWGVYNAIYNPKTNTTDAPGTWRCLSREEWQYLLFTRTTASGIRFALAAVDGVNGLVIVPDNWNACSVTYTLENPDIASGHVNVFTPAQWSVLEDAGCVFLPCAGVRNKLYSYDYNGVGAYRSTTHYSGNAQMSHYLYFYSGRVYFMYYYHRNVGLPVRLVKDI